MSVRCQYKGCPREVYNPNNDQISEFDKCIFHMEIGKKQVKRIEDPSNPSEKIVKISGTELLPIKKLFIEEFSAYLEKEIEKEQKNFTLNISGFIFPDLDQDEWLKAWFSVSRFSKDLNHNILDFDSKSIVLKAEKAKFTGKVFFQGAKFLPLTSFQETIFCDYANFTSSKFTGETIFNLSKFCGEANFQRLRIEPVTEKVTDNTEKEMNDKAWPQVYFSNVVFQKEVNFKFAKFYEDTLFNFSTFHNKACFQNSHFFQNASFDKANFKSKVDFNSATFQYSTKESKKKGIKVGGITSFIESNFHDEAIFSNARFFGEKTSFEWTQFNGKIHFDDTQFAGNTNFSKCRIKNELALSECKYAEGMKIDFKSAEIYGDLRIRDDFLFKDDEKEKAGDYNAENAKKRMSKENLERAKNLQWDFTDLRFYREGHLIIEKIDLSQTTFWDTKFIYVRPRVDFHHVTWPTPKRNPKIQKFRKLLCLSDKSARCLHDEDVIRHNDKLNIFTRVWRNISLLIELIIEKLKRDRKDIKEPLCKKIQREKKTQIDKLEEVERQYRQVRIAYEHRGDYNEAGDFFVGEMNTRTCRLLSQKKWFLGFLNFVYGFGARWGESPKRSLISFFVFALFFTSLLMLSGFSVRSSPAENNLSDSDNSNRWVKINYDADFPADLNQLFIYDYWKSRGEDLGHSAVYTFSAMTLFRTSNKYMHESPWSGLIILLAHVVGVGLIAILGISLRRKFRRMSSE
jgi:uncharacterized protein YjbI with pentapeptide repeats